MLKGASSDIAIFKLSDKMMLKKQSIFRMMVYCWSNRLIYYINIDRNSPLLLQSRESKAQIIDNIYSKTDALQKIVNDHNDLIGFSRAVIYRELLPGNKIL